MARALGLVRLTLCAVAFAAFSFASSADRADAQQPRAKKAAPAAEEIGLFDAIKAGKIDANLILKNEKQGNLLIKNKGDKPLAIRMPDGFAGKPVLAQIGGGLGGLGGLGGVGGGLGGNQGVGGNLGGGLGGGLFNVAPEQLKKAKVVGVCLEHGKPIPNPRVKYQIIPISEYTDDARVHELVAMLDSPRVNQRAAQVAAWHLASDMSFDELAAKTLKFANGTVKPYFSRAEILTGMEIVGVATAQAKQNSKTAESVSSKDR